MNDLREVSKRLDAQDRALERIEAKVDKTNGTVRKHEVLFAEMRGAKRAIGWVPPFATALASSAFSVLLYSIFLAH